MKDRAFIDTNILVYHATELSEKKELIINALKSSRLGFISIQVINEFINTSIKKKLFDKESIRNIVKAYIKMFSVAGLTTETIDKALSIRDKYQYSYYDSLIIATALENNCTILYSEDMQNGQIIENTLKITNPFINS